eukprot:7122425-Pyramimonas_sp.AAC.1
MVSAVGWVSKGDGLLPRDVAMSIHFRLSLLMVSSAPIPPAGLQRTRLGNAPVKRKRYICTQRATHGAFNLRRSHVAGGAAHAMHDQ